MSLALKELPEMLSYCRPASSYIETLFRRRYIESLPSAFCDDWGNYHVKVGESRVMWSCHTDTVHWSEGRQTIHIDRATGRISLSKRSKQDSRCLGADDTAGVFLMRQMILRGVPGYYVFHYGEERGGLGSDNLARNHGDWFAQSFDACIALDRHGTQDIITHQGWERTASDVFAQSLASQLGAGYKPSDEGVFTDSANYAPHIAECTNLSVGYYHEHSRAETVDAYHLDRLLDRLCALDQSQLVIARDPSVVESLGLGEWGLGEWKHGDLPIVDGNRRSRSMWLHEEFGEVQQALSDSGLERCELCNDWVLDVYEYYDDHLWYLCERCLFVNKGPNYELRT